MSTTEEAEDLDNPLPEGLWNGILGNVGNHNLN